MVIKDTARGFSALSLALVPLLSAPVAQAAAAPEVTTPADAVGLVKGTEEDRTGYTRTKFKHWNSGDDAGDGCNTRAEVLIGEAVVAPTVEAGCKLTGGTWVSYYDGQEVTSAAPWTSTTWCRSAKPGTPVPRPGRQRGARHTRTIRVLTRPSSG